ncbi:MAG TPA: hypothetical protein VEW66_08790 [Thermomicrobiales bacterium]|nr:hypothetical protein [Thermomicrobiales bacterium]
MTDRTLENADPSAQHHDPNELNDQREVTQDAPNVPGADPVRFPSKSGDGSSDSAPTEITEDVEQREFGFEEKPGS